MMRFLKTLTCNSVRSKYKYKTLQHYEPRKRSYVADDTRSCRGGLQVTVTSRVMIKPSSPTPGHLNAVRFSLLDQLASSYHTPVILLYQNDDTYLGDRSMVLRKSLSKTLVKFYPLAGRIRGNELIDCQDQGAEFCDASVNRDLADVIENPNLGELKALLPFQTMPNHKNILLSVQLNRFSCGGLAVGLRLSHKIADGGTAIDFIRAWADTTRCPDLAAAQPVDFNGASLIPPMEELSGISPGDYIPLYTEKLGSKTVVFDVNQINRMRAEMGDSVSGSSHVEVVSALIWKHMMGVPNANINTAMHAMSFRTLVEPPIPTATFGNFGCTTSTSPMSEGPRTEYPELVYQLRQAINKIDDNYLTPMTKGDSDQRLVEINKERHCLFLAENKCCFNNWTGFRVYDANFGMGGRPVWVCEGVAPVKNMVNLWSTNCGHGIQASIHMLEDHISTISTNLQHDRLLFPIV